MGKAKSHGFSKARLERIDRFLQEKYVAPGRLPCAQFLLARDGEVIHQTLLGQQDPERGTPIAEDTVFRIYSMTKPITSVALMMLVEEGAIALDDPVAKHIPEWGGLGVYSAGLEPAFLTKPNARPMQVVDLLRRQGLRVTAVRRELPAVELPRAHAATPTEIAALRGQTTAVVRDRDAVRMTFDERALVDREQALQRERDAGPDDAGHQHLVAVGRNDVCVNMRVAAKHRQPANAQLADLQPGLA